MADYKHIVRIVNTDLDGAKPIGHALTKIKGIGKMMANAVCQVAGVSRTAQTGRLSEGDVKALDNTIRNPGRLPEWLYNRRKDYATGEDKHLLTSDLDFTQNNDIRRLKKVKSRRGLRLQAGLPVRGQRTKSNFRRNKGKVKGVKRKK